MKEEYGSTGNVRWLNPSNVTAYNTEGNEMLCKCGKPSIGAIIGKDAYISFCEDCSPFKSKLKP